MSGIQVVCIIYIYIYIYIYLYDTAINDCSCFFTHSDQVLSITVSTQEHVDTVQNLTNHNEVRGYLLTINDWHCVGARLGISHLLRCVIYTVDSELSQVRVILPKSENSLYNICCSLI